MKTVEQLQNIPESGIIIRPEGGIVRLFFDITPAQIVVPEGEDESCAPDDLCDCHNVDVKAPVNYGSIIAAIVNDKYSADDAQALISNFTEAKDENSSIEQSKREEYLDEWTAFQQWRAKAKEIAAYVVEHLNK